MQATPPSKEALRALKIIDADTHLTEVHDLWTRRAPASMKERVPQVKTVNGQLAWVIDGDKSIGDGAPTNCNIRKDGTKVHTFAAMKKLKIEEVHPGSWDVKPRLAIMDDLNIWAQIVYPNILGFGGQRTTVVDPKLRLLSVQIYNDAMAELQEESGQRLFPMALLPWWDVKEAAKETERCARMGLRGINIHTDPHEHKDENGQHLPDLAVRYWDPLWEVCESLDLSVNFHIGASEQTLDWSQGQNWPSISYNMRAALSGGMLFFNNGRVLGNIIYSGILDRFPGLKFVSVESGIGWIPFLLEALDYQYLEATDRNELQRMPSEYFKSNFYCCFWFEKNRFVNLAREVGIDNIMFETDFPHPTSLYPITDETFALPGFTDEERAKVLHGNAAKVYNIKV